MKGICYSRFVNADDFGTAVTIFTFVLMFQAFIVWLIVLAYKLIVFFIVFPLWRGYGLARIAVRRRLWQARGERLDEKRPFGGGQIPTLEHLCRDFRVK